MNIEIKFSEFSAIKSEEGIERATMYVDACSMPNSIPMDCNPRKQNMNSSVVKGIKKTLLEDDGLFHIFNRGITITAEKITIKGDTAIIEIKDTNTQGCIDGGHTYKSILECQPLLRPGAQKVTVEVLTGKTVMDNFVKLAMARNRSQQVQDQSLAELDKLFDWVKETLANEPFKVFYKENDEGNISIQTIVWIMAITNARFPIACHSVRPAAALDEYIEYGKEYGNSVKDNPFYACKNVLVDLLKLYDYCEVHFADKIKFFSRNSKIVKSGKFKSLIYMTPKRYKFPNQFLFPVFSAIREMLKVEEGGMIGWKVNPYDFIKEILPVLADMQFNVYKNNSYTLDRCRDKQSYLNLHEAVTTEITKREALAEKERYENLIKELASQQKQSS